MTEACKLQMVWRDFHDSLTSVEIQSKVIMVDDLNKRVRNVQINSSVRECGISGNNKKIMIMSRQRGLFLVLTPVPPQIYSLLLLEESGGKNE